MFDRLFTEPKYFLPALARHYPLPEALLKLYAHQWDWRLVSQNEAIAWTPELVKALDVFVDWEHLAHNESLVLNDELFRRMKGKTLLRHHSLWGVALAANLETEEEWHHLSANPHFAWTIDFLRTHQEKLDWFLLSSNPGLPWAKGLYQPFIHRWDYGELVSNPGATFTAKETQEIYQQATRSLVNEKGSPNFIEHVLRLLPAEDPLLNWDLARGGQGLPEDTGLHPLFREKVEQASDKTLSFATRVRGGYDFSPEEWQVHQSTLEDLEARREFERLAHHHVWEMVESIPWEEACFRAYADGEEDEDRMTPRARWSRITANPNLEWSANFLQEAIAKSKADDPNDEYGYNLMWQGIARNSSIYKTLFEPHLHAEKVAALLQEEATPRPYFYKLQALTPADIENKGMVKWRSGLFSLLDFESEEHQSTELLVNCPGKVPRERNVPFFGHLFMLHPEQPFGITVALLSKKLYSIFSDFKMESHQSKRVDLVYEDGTRQEVVAVRFEASRHVVDISKSSYYFWSISEQRTIQQFPAGQFPNYEALSEARRYLQGIHGADSEMRSLRAVFQTGHDPDQFDVTYHLSQLSDPIVRCLEAHGIAGIEGFTVTPITNQTRLRVDEDIIKERFLMLEFNVQSWISKAGDRSYADKPYALAVADQDGIGWDFATEEARLEMEAVAPGEKPPGYETAATHIENAPLRTPAKSEYLSELQTWRRARKLYDERYLLRERREASGSGFSEALEAAAKAHNLGIPSSFQAFVGYLDAINEDGQDWAHLPDTKLSYYVGREIKFVIPPVKDIVEATRKLRANSSFEGWVFGIDGGGKLPLVFDQSGSGEVFVYSLTQQKQVSIEANFDELCGDPAVLMQLVKEENSIGSILPADFKRRMAKGQFKGKTLENHRFYATPGEFYLHELYSWVDRSPNATKAIAIAGTDYGDYLGFILEEDEDFVLSPKLVEFMHETAEVNPWHRTLARLMPEFTEPPQQKKVVPEDDTYQEVHENTSKLKQPEPPRQKSRREYTGFLSSQFPRSPLPLRIFYGLLLLPLFILIVPVAIIAVAYENYKDKRRR